MAAALQEPSVFLGDKEIDESAPLYFRKATLRR